MPDNTTNKNIREDEIDLLDLFKRIGKTINKWLNSLGRAILISIVFLIRRWLPLGLSIVAGIVVSYLLKTSSDSLYTSDLIIRSNDATNSEMISFINKFYTSNTRAKSETGSLRPESSENIIDISAFWIIDKNKDKIPDFVDYKNEHNIYDTTNIRMQDRLDIRVIIKSPQELGLVRTSIIKFINSDSLFNQRNRLRLRQNLELLKRLDYDILQLDSLQKVKYFEETRNIKPQSGGQMVFVQEQKTQLVYTDIYNLYSRKQNLESERDLNGEIVTVLSDFSLPSMRDNGASFYGKKIIPQFFGITLLILILLANRKKLLEVYKKY